MEENKQTNGLAVASMVCGILSIILTCVPYVCYIAWALAITGIVLAVVVKKSGKSSMATAGLVCSIIALAIWVILILIVGLLVGASAAGMFGA